MSDLYELLPLYEALLFSAWGGIARYLVDHRDRNKRWCRKNLFTHLFLSCFTGVLAAIYSLGQDQGDMMAILFAGVAGWSGKTVLVWLSDLLKLKVR